MVEVWMQKARVQQQWLSECGGEREVLPKIAFALNLARGLVPNFQLRRAIRIWAWQGGGILDNFGQGSIDE